MGNHTKYGGNSCAHKTHGFLSCFRGGWLVSAYTSGQQLGNTNETPSYFRRKQGLCSDGSVLITKQTMADWNDGERCRYSSVCPATVVIRWSDGNWLLSSDRGARWLWTRIDWIQLATHCGGGGAYGNAGAVYRTSVIDGTENRPAHYSPLLSGEKCVLYDGQRPVLIQFDAWQSRLKSWVILFCVWLHRYRF